MPKNRKDDHVNEASKQYHQNRTDFEDIRFVHHSLPQLNTNDIDLHTTVLGHEMHVPFYINAMTGGSEWTKEVNKQFAMVAKATDLMMATGSVSAAIKDPKVADSFTIVREVNPDGFLLANIGANHDLKAAKQAVELLDADALQIHLNTPQEIVMSEGDRDFRPFIDNVAEIVASLSVPVMVKEVGFGMSTETIAQLHDLGVQTIDISGSGGTNFAAIENERRRKKEMAYLADWGQSTPISLLEAQPYKDKLTLLASGGIKHPLHMVKALALNAKAVGMSGEFLHRVLYEGVDETINAVHEWEEELRLLFSLLNAPNLTALETTDIVLTGNVANWADQRQIDVTRLAHRSQLSKKEN